MIRGCFYSFITEGRDMNIMYAVKPLKGAVEIEPGGTVLMFEPDELEVVEIILCQLLQIVPCECRPVIQKGSQSGPCATLYG